MSTVTKKELIERIAGTTGQKRVAVKQVLQSFLDEVIVELGQDNRLEFRDFGVFEVKLRQGRMAQNPKTMDPVWVPTKRTIRFKAGRQMRKVLEERDAAEGTGGPEVETRPEGAEGPVARIGERQALQAE